MMVQILVQARIEFEEPEKLSKEDVSKYRRQMPGAVLEAIGGALENEEDGGFIHGLEDVCSISIADVSLG